MTAFAYMQRFALDLQVKSKKNAYEVKLARVHMRQFACVNKFAYTQINTHVSKSVHVYRYQYRVRESGCESCKHFQCAIVNIFSFISFKISWVHKRTVSLIIVGHSIRL